MISENILAAFERVANLVTSGAGVLKNPSASGIVVVLLAIGLVIFGGRFLSWSRERKNASETVSRLIVGSQNEANTSELKADFYDRQPEVSMALEELEKNGNVSEKRFAFAWREYRDTLKNDSDLNVLLNGIRPSVFFNAEDLGVEAKGWKIIPGLFVSFGLAATFFGLIAALDQLSNGMQSGAVEVGSIQNFLSLASTKFIMSVTGLVCSIIFSIVLRWKLGGIESSIDELCMAIEKRVGFLALESLSFDQKKLMEDQKEHMQKLNTELIAAIGRSLNEELPKALSASISEAMSPMMSQVGQAGLDGVKDLVGDLSSQLSGDVAKAMGDAADRFDGAGSKIEDVAAALHQSAGGISGSIEKSIDELSVTMTDLRNGLSSGALATRDAFEQGSAGVVNQMNESLKEIQKTFRDANDENKATTETISNAVRVFSERIDAVGGNAEETVGQQLGELSETVSVKLVEALSPMLEQAQRLSKETAENVVKPVHDLTATMGDFVTRLTNSSTHIDGLSSALVKGTNAAEKTSGLLADAGVSLKEASHPMSALAKGLNSTASATAIAATQIAESLSSQEGLVSASLQTLNEAVEEFHSVIERYDDLDEKLGGAFEAFRAEVEQSIARISEHADGIHDKYADALSTLQSVVDQASGFTPANRV